jgi:hypothetical protein
MKTCSICKAEFEGLDPAQDYCSLICRQVKECMDDGSRMIEGTAPSEDSRIFYFPMTFGTLCDLYTVMSIKRANTRSIKHQQEMDYRLGRVKKNITTLLGQLFQDPTHRANMVLVLKKLFRLHATGWALKDRGMNRRYDKATQQEAALEYLQLSEERIGLIQQLDILHAGRTYTYGVMNGKEI